MLESAERLKLFEQVVTENRKRIYLVARSNAPRNCAQDLEQEILTALWQSLDTYEGRSSLSTWVYGIAVNTARYFNREHRRREVILATLPAKSIETPHPEHNLDMVRIVEAFIQSLDEEDRNLFVMYLDDICYADMARVLDREEASLRMKVSRLKKQLRERYGVEAQNGT